MANRSNKITKQKHTRICLDHRAKLQQGLYKEEIFLFDVSLKGICFSTPIKFDLVLEYPCQITFQHPLVLNKPVDMKIKLIRKNMQHVGAYWKEIDIASLRRLASLIEYHSLTNVSLDDVQL